MPYLVLAIGLLMSAIGIGAVAFGYPIIQVERGWASVIAGSTMLAGGLVTIALGLVFQTLIGLKTALLQGAHNGFGAQHVGYAPTGTDLAPSLTDPSLAEPSMGMTAEAPLLTPAMVPVAPPFAAILAPEEPLAEAHREETSHPAHEPVFEPHEPFLHEPFPHEATALTAAEPAGYEFGMPSTPEHDLVPAAPAEAAMPPASDDWLDRAFSDLDHELSGSPKDTQTAALHEPPAHPPETLQQEIVHQETLHHPAAHEPVPHEEHVHGEHAHDELAEHAADVALAERPAEHASAVIGRYESEGTSYVMYADGSIEAQSDAGLYRFASMAELKSFIEG